MNLRNLKIIGIHKGSNMKYNYNLGTFMKKPINEFINKYKDYIETIIESPKANLLGGNIENKINKISSELEISLNLEKEKNRELEEEIKKLKALLNNNNINNYKDLNKGKQEDLIYSVLKKDKEIEDLKTKLARFPFQLLQGEKLMSIIIASFDDKIFCPIIWNR